MWYDKVYFASVDEVIKFVDWPTYTNCFLPLFIFSSLSSLFLGLFCQHRLLAHPCTWMFFKFIIEGLVLLAIAHDEPYNLSFGDALYWPKNNRWKHCSNVVKSQNWISYRLSKSRVKFFSTFFKYMISLTNTLHCHK